jgi:flagellar basal body-associated protein FliL
MKKAIAIVIVLLLTLGMIAMFTLPFLGSSSVSVPSATTAQ